MAIHTIMLPDRVRGRELRSIIWDDVAGTVSGEHFRIPDIRRKLEAEKPVTVGTPGGTWDLLDPGHDPAEFLVLLWLAWWPILDDPHRSTLPPVFDGVKVPKPDPGEQLWLRDPETGKVVLQV